MLQAQPQPPRGNTDGGQHAAVQSQRTKFLGRL